MTHPLETGMFDACRGRFLSQTKLLLPQLMATSSQSNKAKHLAGAGVILSKALRITTSGN